MSSVHHKTAYKEVAVEQGENNKPQSSKSLIQSKFIYIAFAIVFVVILVQGIVLYCVLKPSSSTKQQSLFLDKIVKSACNQKSSKNIQNSSTNSVNLFGITVDTSHLIHKIESTLNSTFGSIIHFKPTGDCLGRHKLEYYMGNPYYHVLPVKCDDSPSQKWHKVQNQIQVGSKSYYPDQGAIVPCLACGGWKRSCPLQAYPCGKLNNDSSHNFIIRIYPSQIDLVNSRVYFSIHNELHSNQCIGLQDSDKYANMKVFHLQECTGSDDQSFYLEDANLIEEIEAIRTQLSSVMWSVLLGSDARQNC